MIETKTVGIDPPGVFIKIELETRGWSQRDLAFILGQTEQQLNPLLSGKRAITPDTARALGDAFDVSPELFLNLQNQYDLTNAKAPDPGVKTRAGLQASFPVREMIRRGWIKDGEASLLKLQIERFYDVISGTDNSGRVAFAAKKAHYQETTAHQLAWVCRVRQLARHLNVPPYSESSLRDSLPKLRSLAIDPEAVKEVPVILASAGIRLIVVEALPGAKIDGVCTWIEDDSPVIGLSTLHDRLDNFWFVLRHEIEHVLLGHGKNTLGMIDHFASDGSCEQDSVVEEEILANVAATEFLVPKQKMDSFYNRKHPYFSERDVIGFSSIMQVHPAIVVGQLQRRMNRYDYLRKYQVPVRSHLVTHAVSDGWGSVVAAEL